MYNDVRARKSAPGGGSGGWMGQTLKTGVRMPKFGFNQCYLLFVTLGKSRKLCDITKHILIQTMMVLLPKPYQVVLLPKPVM